MAKYMNPLDMWSTSLEVGMMALEAQAVIAMRLMGMAGVWSVTKTETSRMVTEKSAAMTKSMMNAGTATMRGASPEKIVAEAIKPYRQKTRANSRRLAKRGPKLR